MAYRETAHVRAKKEAARERIVAAALLLVAQRGFGDVSIGDIALQAQVATGSVYRHFPSKAELFSEVFRMASQREVDKVAEAIAQPGSAEDRLRLALVQFGRRALRGKRLAYALIAEPIDLLVDSDRLEYRRRYADVFAHVIREGIERGEFPPQDCAASSAAVVGAIAECLVGPLAPVPRGDLPGTKSPQDFDEDQLIHSILTFCLRAITGKEHSA